MEELNVILRLHSRLKARTKTIIWVLMEVGYHNYVELFRFAVNRVLMQYPYKQKDANQMTVLLI